MTQVMVYAADALSAFEQFAAARAAGPFTA
jgi:hypothetical protein